MILVGVTGYGTAVLFVLHGAPDLALTQFLVETVTLVMFVLVLRRLPAKFSERPLPGPAVRARRDRRRRRRGRRRHGLRRRRRSPGPADLGRLPELRRPTAVATTSST